jgi:hypothetical protein
MPTEHPKISLYVPQTIYDRFIQYKEESGLSMSQAGTVILAEYFGLKETIKEITEGITIGGVTLDRVEIIEEELKQLKEQVNKLVNQTKTDSKPLNTKSVNQKEVIDKLPDIKNQSTQEIVSEPLILELTSPDNQYRLDNKTLAKRFGLGNPVSVTNASNSKSKSFDIWSREKDPDGIAWQKLKIDKAIFFQPLDDTSSELLGKLREWLKIMV